MRKILEEIKKSKKIVCIYTYTNTLDSQKFDLGYIIDVNRKQVLMLSINTEGNCCGYQAFNINKIYLVETENKYIANIKKKEMEFDCLQVKGRNYIKQILLQSKQQNKCVEIELKNSGIVDVIGFVVEIEHEIVTVNCVDGDENDGKVYLRVKDISFIDIIL